LDFGDRDAINRICAFYGEFSEYDFGEDYVIGFVGKWYIWGLINKKKRIWQNHEYL